MLSNERSPKRYENMQTLIQWVQLFIGRSPRLEAIHCCGRTSGHQPIDSLISIFTKHVISKILNSRYYGRKLITFSGYLAGFVFITIVFKDRLGGLTVAIGVASAGITFSLAGSDCQRGRLDCDFSWWLLQPGDRVQIGGSKGDVIDIGILRTTLMELGEWVNLTFTREGLSASPTALCSRRQSSITRATFPIYGTRSKSL